MHRIEKLFARLEKPGVVLLHARENVRYYSGFTGEGVHVSYPGGNVIVTDFRYTEQAEQQSPASDILMMTLEHGQEKCIHDVVLKSGLKTVYYEENTLTVQGFSALQSLIPDVEWLPLKGAPQQVRMIKEPEEIATIRKAAALTDKAFDHICTFIRPGLTEWDVKVELDYFFVQNGAEGPSFPAIVASGENGSLPHAEPSQRVLRPGDMITLDFGCKIDGYCSDFTRTLCLGRPADELVRIYDIVLQAQLHALEHLRPGLTGKQGDALTRDIINEAGYGDAFGHGTGHGVGLEIHEEPRLSKRASDTLEPGMVVTVEPGIYLPGIGGVRIEDLVVIQPDGIEILSQSTKERIELPC